METFTCGCTRDVPACAKGKTLEQAIHYYADYAYERLFYSDYPTSQESVLWIKAAIAYIDHYQNNTWTENYTPVYEKLNAAFDALMEGDDALYAPGMVWETIWRLGWIASQSQWDDDERILAILELSNSLDTSFTSNCLQIILLNALCPEESDFAKFALVYVGPPIQDSKPQEQDEQSMPEMVETKEEVQQPVPETPELLKFVEKHLALGQSDVIHDLLGFLAEEMLRLNKEKQALQKSFLDFMEKSLQIQPQPDANGKTGIDAMKNKSQLVNYVGEYQKGEEPLSWSRMQEIFKANKKLCRVDNMDQALFELERAYHQNLDKVLPLKNQLQNTDWLIDQTVYRLYGLTEEEIRVVEASTR